MNAEALLRALIRLEAFTHGHEGWQDDHYWVTEEAREVILANGGKFMQMQDLRPLSREELLA